MTELIKIDTEIAKSFHVDIAQVQEMVSEYQKLTLTPDDKESYAVCRKALTACVTNRTSIDKRRKELNAEDHERIKTRNNVAKQLIKLIAPAEEHLSKLVKGEDARIEAIKAEAARKEQERVDGIRELIKGIQSMTASLYLQPDLNQLEMLMETLENIEIDPEIFMEFTAEANETKALVRTDLLKAHEARKEFDAEQERLKAEKEKIEKEKAKLEAQKKAQAEAQAKIDAENQRIERERIEKEAKEKAEQELKEKQERERKEAEEKAKAEAAEKERQEALKPDKDKLRYWLECIVNSIDDKPDRIGQEAKELIESAMQDFDQVVISVSSRIERL